MQRFLTPASGSNSAVPPVSFQADGPDTEAASAEQPGLQLQSMADVKRWLAAEGASEDGPDVKRLREAVSILQKRKPRKEDIRNLQKPSNWNVSQTMAGKPRPLVNVIEELRCKVLQAACRMQK